MTRDHRMLATAALLRTALAVLVWAVLTGGGTSAPLLAGLILAAVVGTSLATIPPSRPPRPDGLLRFLGFFVVVSIRGGIDVARRACARGAVPVRPGFVERDLRLPTQRTRLVCAACLSLLPGTASVELRDRRLTIHLLDTGMPIDAMLESLEHRIADAFGADLD